MKCKIKTVQNKTKCNITEVDYFRNGQVSNFSKHTTLEEYRNQHFNWHSFYYTGLGEMQKTS